MTESFYKVVQEAIADLSEHGYDTEGRLAYWTERLRQAADSLLAPAHKTEEYLRQALGAIYARLVERGAIAHYHLGIDPFTIDRLRPKLRRELDKRILASANLIKLNRAESIERTIRRFQGWATSIPPGGQGAGSKTETKQEVKKALASLPFVERRVIIDQGHKLTASINEVIATDGGALALVWRSHWRQLNYNFRRDHKDRDGRCYALRDNWALKAGLMKVGPDGYYDEITAVGQEPFCRCYATYLYALSKLPDDMITAKGREQLRGVGAKARA